MGQLKGITVPQLKLPPCQYAIEGGKFIRKFAPEGGKELSDRQLADGMSRPPFGCSIPPSRASLPQAARKRRRCLEMETIYRKYLNGASI